MTDTTNLDTAEKVDILIKQSFGFPSTSENKQWYEETSVKFNNYLNGEELFLNVIPNTPDFDICGTVRTSEEVGLVSGDFMNFISDNSDKSTCSIVDDSTGTIRRYRLLILQQTPQLGDDAGTSWYKLNSFSNNVVKDAFQFNFKQYKDEQGNVIQPYLYGLYTQKSTSSVLPFGRSGGNWIFEVKNGIIFFPDFNNFSNGTQTDSKFQINVIDNFPVLTFYKYIGQKGINILNTKLFDISSTVTKIIDGCYNILGSGGSDLSFAIFESSFNEYFNFDDELIIKKDVRITQNLYVDGSFTYINSSVQTIVDPIIELGADSCGNELSVNDGQDRGLKLTYYDDSLNLQKSGFIGLINQSDSNLYNSFALYSDACFNNNSIDLCNSSLGLLNLYGLNSEIINTDKLFNNNDISLEKIKSLDNSSNYVLNFKQLNSYLDSKFFLKEDTFNNFIDYSFNSLINDLSNIQNLLITADNNENNINYNSLLINQNKQSIDNNIDSIEQINNKINNISNVVDNNTDNINDNSLDISNILQSVLDNLNLIYGLSGQIENLSGLTNINKNNIEYLTAFNNLLKADINNNSSIINKNSQDINLLKTNVKLNKETINDNITDINSINDNITDINSINDLISNVLNNIKFLSQQDNLLKADLNYNSSLIKYNSVDNNLLKNKVNNLENTLNNAYYLLNNRFSDLERKLQNAFDFI